MHLNLNNDPKKFYIDNIPLDIKPEELGEYILKKFSAEDREKILKRIAIDKLLNEIINPPKDCVVIPFSQGTKVPSPDRMKKEIIYYLALTEFKGIGTGMLRKLAIQFKSLESLYNEPISNLRELGVATSIIKNLSNPYLKEQALEKALKTINLCKTEDINLLYYEDEYFPNELLIDDTIPFLIFYKGDISFLKRRKVAIFGKKNPSEFGIRAINSLTSSLSSEGYSIIANATTNAGTQASFVSLQNSSPPIAIFPGSLDHASTKLKRRFINFILDGGGLVISVNRPLEPYCYRNILATNKIQIILSKATVIIETDQTLSTSQIIMSSKRFKKPIIAPVPPGNYASINTEIVNLIKNDKDILAIHSRDQYYKIFDLLKSI